MNELVSIITPSYNTARFIGETIESIIAQTYTNWELLIVDDCSSDNTDEIVAKYHDARIRYIKNSKNSGAAISRNTALREAKGRWIAFLDSDDLWMPEKLMHQIAFMEKNEYHFTYTKRYSINEDSIPTGKTARGPKHVGKGLLLRYCWMASATVIYDRNIVGDIQIEPIKKNNDYAMWLKVVKKADCYLLDEYLAKIRGRSGSLTDAPYVSLIKYYFQLYTMCEKKKRIPAYWCAVRNLFYGVLKQIFYIKRYDTNSLEFKSIIS